MSRIEGRPVVFSEWRQWGAPLVRFKPAEGGVYLLAHSRSGTAPARATLESLPIEVVYVGNTKDLNTRPSHDHGGMRLYHKTIDPMNRRLFVTVAPLYVTGCEDYAVQRIYAEHVETLLIWNFTAQHHHPPV